MTQESEWRKAIAEQVRRNCTPSSEAYAKGGDALIYAVADWIESPPSWSLFEPPKTMANERDEAYGELADWLGEQDFAHNVTDYTDEQTTVVDIDVDTLALKLTLAGWRRATYPTESVSPCPQSWSHRPHIWAHPAMQCPGVPANSPSD